MAVPYGENQYIYGLHDPGGEHLLKHEGQARGWILVTEEIRANPSDQGGKGNFYKRLADQGFGVLVRLNHAYGPDGTIPVEAKYRDFARRAANFVKNSPGAHIWIIGNEMNFEREQPRLSPGNRQAEPITPRRYAECYKLCRQAIKSLPGHENDQVVVGAMGPWNAQTPYDADPQGKYKANKIPGAPNEYPYNGFFGDFIHYLRDILLAIGRENCDAIAIHAYSHGYKPDLVFSDEKMGPPFQNYHYHFRTYKDQMKIIPPAFRDLPVYLTEANGDADPGGVKWPDVNRGWIKNVYKEIDDWNKAGNQQIRCVILYRWSRDDDWHIDGKGQVHQDLREAIAKNYTWNPDMAKPKPAPEAEPKPEPQVDQPAQPESATTKPDRPGYLARYLNHNTPASLQAGQTLTVNLTVQNAGSFEWLQGGPQPFRLGFQWYGPNQQMVRFPSELDFRTPLPRNIKPDETVELQARLRTPDNPGPYQLRWDMVHEMVTWFTSQGDPGLVVPVVVTAQPAEQPAAPEQEPSAPPRPITIEAEDITATLAHHPARTYPMRTHADIKRLIIHHTATPPNITVQRIAEFQVTNKELPGITYHFCITAEGIVYQTQYLETVAAHAGEHSPDSVGVCLIGNFTSSPPPRPQLEACAPLLAQLALALGLSTDQIVGYNEIERTQSPGATWPQWKGPLITQVRRLMSSSKPISVPKPKPAAEKAIEHFMLFWHRHPDDWAEWDLQGAFEYIAKFKPVIGFDIQQAKAAKYVTIVGGANGVPGNAERILRAAGCQVERIDGGTESETRHLLQKLAAEGKRFNELK